jgi:hypothetical protein
MYIFGRRWTSGVHKTSQWSLFVLSHYGPCTLTLSVSPIYKQFGLDNLASNKSLLRARTSYREEVADYGQEEGVFGQRQVQVRQNWQVRQRVLRQAPSEDHQEGEEVATSSPFREEVSEVAKTGRGKKIVHVPAHTRKIRTKRGRRRVRIPEHYRSTPE